MENTFEIDEFKYLTLTFEPSLAIINLGESENDLNVITQQLLFELALAIEIVEANAKVQVLILTGSDRAFSVGADIKNLNNIQDVYSGREFALAGQEVCNSITTMPIPTIAAIRGAALGGGLELALACDLRIGHVNARLGLPEVRLGLIPGFGGTQRLPRLIGKANALDLILTGRTLFGKEGYNLGILNRLAENAEDVFALAQTVAEEIIPNGPVAIGLAKESIHRGLPLNIHQGLEIEADLFGIALTSQDAKEGTNAFIEKRIAKFSGN